jgi:hypothetical protein
MISMTLMQTKQEHGINTKNPIGLQTEHLMCI